MEIHVWCRDFSVIAAIISLKFSLNSPFWCVIMCSHIACWVHLKRFLSVHVAFGSISKRFIDSFWTHSCVLCSIVHKLCYYFRSLGLIWLGFDLLRLALIAQLLKHSINLSSRRYLSCYIWSWKLKLELKIKHWQCLWKLKHPVLLDLTNNDGCLLDVNLHHFSVTVPTSYRLKFTILRRENFWSSTLGLRISRAHLVAYLM